jgi:hypothetical protein
VSPLKFDASSEYVWNEANITAVAAASAAKTVHKMEQATNSLLKLKFSMK